MPIVRIDLKKAVLLIGSDDPNKTMVRFEPDLYISTADGYRPGNARNSALGSFASMVSMMHHNGIDLSKKRWRDELSAELDDILENCPPFGPELPLSIPATLITCEILTTHPYDQNGINDIVDELMNRYGGNLNIRSVSCVAVNVQVSADKDDIYEGIYLALDKPECPGCGKNLKEPLSLVITPIDANPESDSDRIIKANLRDDGTVLPEDEFHDLQYYDQEEQAELVDVCCGDCKESLMHVMYAFEYVEGQHDEALQKIKDMI